MSCICQYFVHSKDGFTTEAESETNPADTQGDSLSKSDEDNCEHLSKTNVSATELATARAEIWLLTKNLNDARITIENLESLVKTLMEKQNAMLTEIYHLKRFCHEQEEECRLQRDYHAMERNAMIRELHDTKVLLNTRSKQLDEILQKNVELTNNIQEANEKIYLAGIKYLRLKKAYSQQPSEYSNSSHDLESDDEQTD